MIKYHYYKCFSIYCTNMVTSRINMVEGQNDLEYRYVNAVHFSVIKRFTLYGIATHNA